MSSCNLKGLCVRSGYLVAHKNDCPPFLVAKLCPFAKLCPLDFRVGQGPVVLAIGAGGGCWDIFSLVYHFSFLSPSLWETAQYRMKYCLKGPLSPKQPSPFD